MLNSVHQQIELDAYRVLKTLTGEAPAMPMLRPLTAELFYDLGDGSGLLLDLALAAFEKRDPWALAHWIAQLSCPFHLSNSLFRSDWHQEFDGRLEPLILHRTLPFVYEPESRFGDVSRQGFRLWLARNMAGPQERIIEAYKYGNGFAPLKASGFVDEWYNRGANQVLASWLWLDRTKSA